VCRQRFVVFSSLLLSTTTFGAHYTRNNAHDVFTDTNMHFYVFMNFCHLNGFNRRKTSRDRTYHSRFRGREFDNNGVSHSLRRRRLFSDWDRNALRSGHIISYTSVRNCAPEQAHVSIVRIG